MCLSQIVGTSTSHRTQPSRSRATISNPPGRRCSPTGGTLRATGKVLIEGGTLAATGNGGRVVTTELVNSATVATQMTGSKLTIEGDYTQTKAGTFSLFAGGGNQGQRTLIRL